jgi:hypothetical protein
MSSNLNSDNLKDTVYNNGHVAQWLPIPHTSVKSVLHRSLSIMVKLAFDNSMHLEFSEKGDNTKYLNSLTA